MTSTPDRAAFAISRRIRWESVRVIAVADRVRDERLQDARDCTSRSPQGNFRCSRVDGHGGAHESYTDDERKLHLATWTKADLLAAASDEGSAT